MAEIKTYHQYLDEACACQLPWEELKDANVLISGATGLIGSCLVDVLMNRHIEGLNVYAAGRNEDRAKVRFADYRGAEGFHFLRYDVVHPLDCGINFDFIIHAASNASPNFFKNHPVEVMASNIYGTDNLLKYGMSHGMKRLMYVSTGEVYGEGDGRVFTEDYSGYIDTMNPRSCYPSSKRAAETLCAAYAHEYGADTVIVRPSHVYGPHFTETDNRVYAQFIRNVLRQEDIVLKSSGEQFRSWCFVVDCVVGMLYVLFHGNRGEAYNIADEESCVSIHQLAEMVARIGNQSVVMQIPDGADTDKMITRAVFDTSKLEQLGWHIGGHMMEKLASTINEMKRI